MDLDFRSQLMAAETPEAFLAAIDAKERERFADEVEAEAEADWDTPSPPGYGSRRPCRAPQRRRPWRRR